MRSLKVKVFCRNRIYQKPNSFLTLLQLKRNICLVIIWEVGGHRRQEAGKAWVWTGARNKAIWSLKSTVTMKPTLARKKMFTHLRIPMILNKTTAFPFTSSKTWCLEGKRQSPANPLRFKIILYCLGCSFIKKIKVSFPLLCLSFPLLFLLLSMSLFHPTGKWKGKVLGRVRKASFKHIVKSKNFSFPFRS